LALLVVPLQRGLQRHFLTFPQSIQFLLEIERWKKNFITFARKFVLTSGNVMARPMLKGNNAERQRCQALQGKQSASHLRKG